MSDTKTNSPSMFDTIFTSFDKNKNPSEEDINKISSKIYCQYLSGSPKTIFTANEINLYYNMPMVNQYNLVKSKFGGQKIFIRMPKKNKEDFSQALDAIERHFCVNSEKARDYLEVIDKDELATIVKAYADYDLKHPKKKEKDKNE